MNVYRHESMYTSEWQNYVLHQYWYVSYSTVFLPDVIRTPIHDTIQYLNWFVLDYTVPETRFMGPTWGPSGADRTPVW